MDQLVCFFFSKVFVLFRNLFHLSLPSLSVTVTANISGELLVDLIDSLQLLKSLLVSDGVLRGRTLHFLTKCQRLLFIKF